MHGLHPSLLNCEKKEGPAVGRPPSLCHRCLCCASTVCPSDLEHQVHDPLRQQSDFPVPGTEKGSDLQNTSSLHAPPMALPLSGSSDSEFPGTHG
jgi:hypothetical protein